MNNHKTIICYGSIVVLLTIIGFLFIMCSGWLTGGFHYSDGYREGHVQKFSHKGIIWITYEGEMALRGLRTRGSGDDVKVSNTWEFSALDPEIIKQLHDIHEYELVRIHYDQYLFSPPWRGSTGYRITKIERIHKDHP